MTTTPRGPQTLSDIVLPDPGRWTLGLALPGDVAALRIPVVAGREPERVADWRFVAIRDALSDMVRIYLLGERAGSERPIVTSRLMAVCPDTGHVVTHSGSVYRLEGAGGQGEPPPPHLRVLYSALHNWGLGQELTVTRST